LGDFRKTIEDCDVLLKDKSRFRRDSAGFVRNIQWNLMVAEQVRRLRERVAFHSIKMLKVVKPLEIKLFSDLQQEVLNVRLDIADLGVNIFRRFDRMEGILVKNIVVETEKMTVPVEEQLPTVPEYLSQRFEEAAAPRIKGEAFPLADGVDALAFHFDKSTVKFRPVFPLMVTPEPLQYLDLMKSIWILGKLKSNPLYSRAISSDKLWQGYLKEFELNLLQEIKRFDSVIHPLLPPSQQDILILPKPSFSIFVVPASTVIKPSLLDARPGEEKILAMSLQDLSDSRKQDIVVFRRSTSRVRIVTVTSSATETDREIEGPEVDLTRAALLPFYASPETPQGIYNIGWKNSLSDHDTFAMSFRSFNDLLKFQQCVTNYQVVHSKPSLLSAKTKKNGPFNSAKQLATHSTIQIWIHKPSPAIDPASPSSSLAPPSPAGLRKSSTGFSTATKAESFTTKYASSLNPSSTITATSAGSLLHKPEPPLLVIYTSVQGSDGEKTPGFVTLTLTPRTLINRNACDCKRERPEKPSPCTRAVIESKDSLDINVYSFKSGSLPNLAALRTPDHVDKGANREVLKGMGFLALDFASREERVGFVARFEECGVLFARRLASYWEDLGNVRGVDVGDGG
jgi:hypothetical protein